MRKDETFPVCSHTLFLQLYRASVVGSQPLWCCLETMPRKWLQHIPSFATNPPPEVGVVGGSWCRVIYRAEPIIQTHFPLSADPLCKRWSLIRNLKHLAHLGNLGDACSFSKNISLQTGSAGCCISVLFPLCCTLAICLNENCPCVSSRSEQGGRSFQKKAKWLFFRFV